MYGMRHLTLPAFSVIGREGSSVGISNIANVLWQEANEHFGEIAHLAKKDSNGMLTQLWGIMSDLERKFQPWTDGFSKGLYLAGVEVEAGSEPPEGWSLWDVPARDYLVVTIENGDYTGAMQAGLTALSAQGLRLAGAICDHTDLIHKRDELYFPVGLI